MNRTTEARAKRPDRVKKKRGCNKYASRGPARNQCVAVCEPVDQKGTWKSGAVKVPELICICQFQACRAKWHSRARQRRSVAGSCESSGNYGGYKNLARKETYRQPDPGNLRSDGSLTHKRLTYMIICVTHLQIIVDYLQPVERDWSIKFKV